MHLAKTTLLEVAALPTPFLAAYRLCANRPALLVTNAMSNKENFELQLKFEAWVSIYAPTTPDLELFYCDDGSIFPSGRFLKIEPEPTFCNN